MNYQSGIDELLPPLDAVIRELHQVVGNARTDGYELVLAYGAFMVLDSALYVITQAGDQDYYNVMAQTPFYARYPILTENGIATRRTSSGHVQRNWNISADIHAPNTIEILTIPNNPDGQIRPPVLGDRSRVIADLVYYWPAFVDNVVGL